MSSDRFFHRDIVGGGRSGHARVSNDWQLAGRERWASGRYRDCMGLLSAIVDNVPLVAASMGMYSLTQYPANSFLWELFAYCGRHRRSILIIGSRRECCDGPRKIHFFWYVRRTAALALRAISAGHRLHRAVQLLHDERSSICRSGASQSR